MFAARAADVLDEQDNGGRGRSPSPTGSTKTTAKAQARDQREDGGGQWSTAVASG